MDGIFQEGLSPKDLRVYKVIRNSVKELEYSYKLSGIPSEHHDFLEQDFDQLTRTLRRKVVEGRDSFVDDFELAINQISGDAYNAYEHHPLGGHDYATELYNSLRKNMMKKIAAL